MICVIIRRAVGEAAGVEQLLARVLCRLEAEQVIGDFASIVHLMLVGARIKVRV